MDDKTLVSLLSHELRSTLWGAEGLIRLMQEDMPDQLGEEATNQLVKVREGIEEGRSLLTRLIDLYRLPERPVRKERTDIGEIAREEWNKLIAAGGDPKAVFDCGETPTVVTDSRWTRQILNELLGNALKAVNASSMPRISLRASARSGGLAIEIQDNGIGFPSDQADKLFEPCGRAHSRTRFPGTGLGLAMVREMVERLGGTVWAEGETHQGATFGFTIAK